MIQRSTLRSQIATALSEEILAGRLPAGREFTVKEIAEQYGVSATPVREALVDLAAQGLLDIEQHRGYRVHEFTADDYRAMVRARSLIMDGLLHQGALPQGVPRGLDAAVDQATTASVRRRADSAARAARAGDLDVLIGYDLRFWRELGSIVDNSYIREFLERLRLQCWVFAVPRLRRHQARHGNLCGRLWAGHREALDAVERGDTAGALRLLSEHDAHALTLVDGPDGEVERAGAEDRAEQPDGRDA